MIEDPCSNLQGIFDRKEVCHFQIRSLTPQQSAGNALAFAVHIKHTKHLSKLYVCKVSSQEGPFVLVI